jgi:hypothetical protein
MMGDFNARTGTLDDFESGKNLYNTESFDDPPKRSNQDRHGVNAYGKKLVHLCKEAGMIIANGRVVGDHEGAYTFLAHQGKSVIDYCLLSNKSLEAVRSFMVDDRPESSHLPIVLCIKNEGKRDQIVAAVIQEETTIKIPRFIYHEDKDALITERFNWYQTFMLALINAITNPDDSSSIESSDDVMLNNESNLVPISCFHQLLGTILAPMKKKTAKNKFKPFVKTSDKMLKKVKRALKLFRKTRQDIDLDEYLVLKKRLKETLAQERQDETIEHSAQVDALLATNDWKSIWQKLKRFTGKRAPSVQIPPSRWVSHFQMLFNNNSGEFSRPEWDVDFESLPDVSELDSEIDLVEIIKVIRSKKGKTAPGHDGVNMEIVKKYQRFLYIPLMKLFNHILTTGVYPRDWSLAIIHPLFKNSGAPSNPDNYRGISLLPCISKIFTKIIANRLLKWATNANILSEFQAGFRPKHSTIDQLYVLQSIVEARLRRKQPTYCAMIDFRKAFDRVNRQGLYFVLAKLGLSKKLLKVVKSMYDSSRYAIKVNQECISQEIPANIGVMQGCQLSPLLFILFINQLVDYLKNVAGSHPPALDDFDCPVLLFADDIALLSNSPGGLQKLLNQLEKFCEYYKMEVNPDKSKVIVFKNSPKLRKHEKWLYKAAILDVVKNFKYLGLSVSFNNHWRQHIETITRKSVHAAGPILRFVNKVKTGRWLKIGIRLFDAMVAPMALYGSELFCMAKSFEKLERVPRCFYKRLLGLPTSAANVGCEVILGRSPLAVDARMRMLKYWFKILFADENRLIKKAYVIQRRSADQGIDCWAGRVKSVLDLLGFSFLWIDQDYILPEQKKGLISMLKARLKESAFTFQMESTRCLRSTEHLSKLCKKQELLPFFRKLRTRALSRNLAKVALLCPGSLVEWNNNYKKCSACSQEIDGNIFMHRLTDCTTFASLRKKFEQKRWFLKSRFLPSRVFITYMLNSNNVDFLKFMF